MDLASYLLIILISFLSWGLAEVLKLLTTRTPPPIETVSQ